MAAGLDLGAGLPFAGAGLALAGAGLALAGAGLDFAGAGLALAGLAGLALRRLLGAAFFDGVTLRFNIINLTGKPFFGSAKIILPSKKGSSDNTPAFSCESWNRELQKTDVS